MKADDLGRSPVYVLGAPGDEMRAISSVLRATHTDYCYATRGGIRLVSGETDAPDPVVLADATKGVVFVECDAPLVSAAGQALGSDVARRRCGHRHRGDSGHGVAPGEFTRGSSLGHVLELLGETGRLARLAPADAVYARVALAGSARAGLTRLENGTWALAARDTRLRLRVLNVEPETVMGLAYVAAGSHWLAAAYAGRCPGIDPERLRESRAAARFSAGYGQTLKGQEEEFVRARSLLRRNLTPAGVVDIGQGMSYCPVDGMWVSPQLASGANDAQTGNARCPRCEEEARWLPRIPMLEEAAAWLGIGLILRSAASIEVMGLPESRLREIMAEADTSGMAVYGGRACVDPDDEPGKAEAA